MLFLNYPLILEIIKPILVSTLKKYTNSLQILNETLNKLIISKFYFTAIWKEWTIVVSPSSEVDSFFQDNKEGSTTEGDEVNGDVDNQDYLENDREDRVNSPESINSRTGKEVEDILGVKTNGQGYNISHAVSIVSTPATQPASSPSSLAATAPSSDDWKATTLIAPY